MDLSSTVYAGNEKINAFFANHPKMKPRMIEKTIRRRP